MFRLTRLNAITLRRYRVHHRKMETPPPIPVSPGFVFPLAADWRPLGWNPVDLIGLGDKITLFSSPLSLPSVWCLKTLPTASWQRWRQGCRWWWFPTATWIPPSPGRPRCGSGAWKNLIHSSLACRRSAEPGDGPWVPRRWQRKRLMPFCDF